MTDNDGPGQACVDTRDTVGRIYKVEYHTLLNTKYESSGSCGFRDVLCFPIASLCELSVAMETSVLIRPE